MSIDISRQATSALMNSIHKPHIYYKKKSGINLYFFLQYIFRCAFKLCILKTRQQSWKESINKNKSRKF